MASDILPKDFEYFILVAEELNITKAAQRAFVSQQALSKYIKSLEKRYGTELFYRKPVFRLTPAGEILFERAKQLQQLTDTLSQELDCIKNGIDGHMNFGISYGRSFAVIPKVVRAMRTIYPSVKISIDLINTAQARQRILDGDMDIALGISPEPSSDLEMLEITTESIYLGISDRLLQIYFPNEYPDCIYAFRNGVNLHDFEHIPFCFNPTSIHIDNYVKSFLEKEKVNLSFMVTTDSNELNINLCDIVATFVLQFLIPNIKNYNEHSQDNPINIFPIPGLENCNTVTIMFRKDRKRTQYMDYFIEVLRKTVSENLYLFSSETSKHGSFLMPW